MAGDDGPAAGESEDAHAGEAAAIAAVEDPVTVDSLVADLHELGVEPGDTLLAHAAMSSLGWVAGGAPAVVDALREAVTAAGTLVMPTHSTQNADPSDWENPPLPADWIAPVKDALPPYRPAVTPANRVGAVPECFRTYPDAIRSRHPTLSFAAWGADAEAVVADHPYDDPMGEGSPLATVYDLDGRVLRLGTDANTSLHLAESRAAARSDDPWPRVENGAPVLVDGEREWLTFAELGDTAADFRATEAAFDDATGGLRRGPVGAAEATLCSQRNLVDFATERFAAAGPDRS